MEEQNKKNNGLIIGIIIALIIIGVVVVILMNSPKKSTTNNNDDVNANTSTNTSNKYSTCAKVGNQCTDKEITEGQLVSVSVNKKTSYDFYVIKDDGTKLTLLKAGSLGDAIEWTSKDDSVNIFKGETGRNYFGPYTALKYLNELTKDWDKIDVIKDYSFQDPKTDGDNKYTGLDIKNGTISLTTKDSEVVSVPGEARARLLTLEEFNEIKPANSSYIDWLSTKLKEEKKNDKSEDSYEHIARIYMWLLDAGDFSNRPGRAVSYNQVTEINVENKGMLYPVITIDKKQIN